MNWEVKAMRSESLSSRKGPLFGLSGMWVNMMLKRDLIIMFVALAAYFLVCMFPVILFFHSFGDVAGYMRELLMSEFTAVPFISGLYAVVLSVMLFDYLHNSASCAAAHSFPMTRGKLYRSSLLTGTILLLAPLLAMAIGMFILGLAAPVDGLENPRIVMSAEACAKWFIDNALGSLFIFAISNLAGILAGRNVIHVLLAYLLNGIVGIVFILIDAYADSFILGVEATGLTDKALWSNPFLWYMGLRQHALELKDAPVMLAFFAAMLMITIITGLLYKKIKLEREQNATVFPFVSDLLVIFCSFCSMSVIGLSFAMIAGSEAPTLPLKTFLITSLIAGLASFVVFRMIADSSARIFHMRTLVNFAAFVLVTCAIFAFTCFDITGQAVKVPEVSAVKSVTINTGAVFSTPIDLNEKGSIESVINLHKAIIDSTDELSKNSDADGSTVEITYKLKDGSTLKRTYEFRNLAKYKDAASEIDKLEKSDEFSEQLELIADKITRSKRGVTIYTDLATVTVKNQDIQPLFKAYIKDRRNNSLSYYLKLNHEDEYGEGESGFGKTREGLIGIEYDEAKALSGEDYSTLSLRFGKKDKNVLKFLEDNGYSKEIIELEKE